MIDLRGLGYNPETGIFTVTRSGGRRKAGDAAGYIKSDGYRLISYLGRYRYAHRLAWFAVHGEMPSGEIDHINGNRDDNRIANLRLVTRSQNMMNAAIGKGWHWHKKQQRWQALIRVGGERKYLGQFKTEAEAQAAYEKARAELHGRFAVSQRPAPAEQMGLEI